MPSPPLGQFLNSVGKIQHHLHTVVVGLASVETGNAIKPDDLNISWNPNDAISSAREARRFVLRATLILFAEELKEYATQVLKFRALESGEQLEPPSIAADRIRKLIKPEEVEPSYLTVAPVLVANWRNRIVHHASNAGLTSSELERFRAQAEVIGTNYKNVDVKRLLNDFESNAPTLKDVTALLAMSIRFVRIVDSKLPPPASAHHVRLWLDAEGLTAEVLKHERRAENGGSPNPRARARQYLRTKSPALADPYFVHGIAV